MANPRFGLAAKLLTALLSVSLSLAIAEWAARRYFAYVTPLAVEGKGVEKSELVYFTPRGKRHVPGVRASVRNHTGFHEEVEIVTNALGFRDAEIVTPKPDGLRRILAIGDSITLGGYLPARDLWVEVLEDRLDAADPLLRVEVVNAGVADSGLREEVNLLEDEVSRVDPDLVLLAFYLNDSRPPMGFPGELGAPGWLRRNSVLADTLYRRFKLRSFVEQTGAERFAWVRARKDLAWKSDPQALRELADMARFDWGAAWQADSWESVAAELDRLEQLSLEHDFAVVVVAFPVTFQVEAEFVDDLPQRKIETLARARGFGFVDLLGPLRELQASYDREGTGRRVFYDQCHPTPASNRVIAEVIAGPLAE